MRGHVRAVKGVVERQGAPGLFRLDLFLNNPGSLTNLWVVKLQRLRVCSTTSAARAIAPVPGQVVNSVTEFGRNRKTPASSGPKVQEGKIGSSAVRDFCCVPECIYCPTIYCSICILYIYTCV